MRRHAHGSGDCVAGAMQHGGWLWRPAHKAAVWVARLLPATEEPWKSYLISRATVSSSVKLWRLDLDKEVHTI